MIQRCYNPNKKSYARYGAKGVYVCPEWRTFEGFLADMENSYEEGLTLDRKDSSGPYHPANCWWIPREMQTITGKLSPRKDNTSGIPGVEIYRKGYRVLVKLAGRDGPKKTLYYGPSLDEAIKVRLDWEAKKKAEWSKKGYV